jgi:polysaccharide pyruvyl transferase WcaK-like protein
VKQPVHRVALYGYPGSCNLGNDASFEMVVPWSKAHPQIDFRRITIAPEQVGKQYGIASVPLAWRSPRRARSRTTETVQNLVGRLPDVPRSHLLTGSVDAVIVPGMGVLENSLTARHWPLPYWLSLIALACRNRGRRFVLLDVGAERAAHPVPDGCSPRRLAWRHTRASREVTTFAELTCEMRSAEVVGPPVGYADKCRTLMQALGLDGYHQHIDQLDAGRLIVQVRAAQRDPEALAAQIRAAESHYGGEVESLLRRVTGEELGLDAHQPQQLAVNDGTGAWRAG